MAEKETETTATSVAQSESVEFQEEKLQSEHKARSFVQLLIPQREDPSTPTLEFMAEKETETTATSVAQSESVESQKEKPQPEDKTRALVRFLETELGFSTEEAMIIQKNRPAWYRLLENSSGEFFSLYRNKLEFSKDEMKRYLTIHKSAVCRDEEKVNNLLQLFGGKKELVRSVVFRVPRVLEVTPTKINSRAKFMLEEIFGGDEEILRYELWVNPSVLQIPLDHLHDRVTQVRTCGRVPSLDLVKMSLADFEMLQEKDTWCSNLPMENEEGSISYMENEEGSILYMENEEGYRLMQDLLCEIGFSNAESRHFIDQYPKVLTLTESDIRDSLEFFKTTFNLSKTELKLLFAKDLGQALVQVGVDGVIDRAKYLIEIFGGKLECVSFAMLDSTLLWRDLHPRVEILCTNLCQGNKLLLPSYLAYSPQLLRPDYPALPSVIKRLKKETPVKKVDLLRVEHENPARTIQPLLNTETRVEKLKKANDIFATVNFFRKMFAFSDKEIKRLLTYKLESVLGVNTGVPKVLKNTNFLLDFFDGNKDVTGFMIQRFPDILMSESMEEAVKYLHKDLFSGDKEILQYELSLDPWVLFFGMPEIRKRVGMFSKTGQEPSLSSFGISPSQYKSMLEGKDKSGSILPLEKCQMQKLLGEIGFSEAESRHFIGQNPEILTLTESDFRSSMEFFKSTFWLSRTQLKVLFGSSLWKALVLYGHNGVVNRVNHLIDIFGGKQECLHVAMLYDGSLLWIDVDSRVEYLKGLCYWENVVLTLCLERAPTLLSTQSYSRLKKRMRCLQKNFQVNK